MTEIINEKIHLLYDFCVLRHPRKCRKDPREELCRKALAQCRTEREIERVLHDVTRGRKSLNEVLKQKGLM